MTTFYHAAWDGHTWELVTWLPFLRVLPRNHARAQLYGELRWPPPASRHCLAPYAAWRLNDANLVPMGRGRPSGRNESSRKSLPAPYTRTTMQLFVIIPLDAGQDKLDATVRNRFGNDCMKLPMSQWLVAYSGTSKQLSDELEISEGQVGVNALVLAFNGYWGRASKAVWEWISTNQARQ